MNFWGVVVAAGAGTRYGGPKQEALLDGKPLWRWAEAALAEAGAAGVVVVGNMPGAVPGGERRRDSVKAGLARVPLEVPYVLVHDAARPLATSRLAIRVASRLETGDVDGVVPVVALRDTIKSVMGDVVVETLDRSELVAAQTPQGFVTAVLRQAHAQVEGDAPDDGYLVERMGGRIATVLGEEANMKVTYAMDLQMLESQLR